MTNPCVIQSAAGVVLVTINVARVTGVLTTASEEMQDFSDQQHEMYRRLALRQTKRLVNPCSGPNTKNTGNLMQDETTVLL
jgi:hypothetical protein